jgi:hypothetical protein
MKTLLRLFATVHGLMALLFACAALVLIAIAGRIGWGVFVRLNRYAEELEPEAMAAAKREDRKLK